MSSPGRPPVEPEAPKLLASPRLKLQIAALCAVVLTVGALLAPRSASPPMVAPSQEHAAPLLGEQVQSREASRPFGGIQDVAARLRGSSVTVVETSAAAPTVSDFSTPPAMVTAAGFGVHITATQILTHAEALEGRTTVRLVLPGGLSGDAEVVAFDPPTGLTLLQGSWSGARVATLAGTAPEPGALAIAAAWADGRDIAVPLFVTSAAEGRFSSSAVDALILPGMPIYTLDGELFAVAAGRDPSPELIAVRDVASRLLVQAASGARIGSFGVTLQTLTAGLASAFGDRGVLIADVLDGGPADAAGLRPGDVLLAIGDRELIDADAAARIIATLPVNTEAPCQILRAGRPRTLGVSPVTAYEVSAAARAAGGAVSAAPAARALFEAADLQRSGIAPDSRILLVNGRAVASRVQAARELQRGSGPVPVLVRHRERQYFAVIEPQR
jgi:S1-C subfamily serine protease